MKAETILYSLKKYKILLLISLLILLVSPALVYYHFFNDLKPGGPSEFADFATYYSGILLPLLTVLSVLFLGITIIQQGQSSIESQARFSRQLDLQMVDSYIQRFDVQYERYLLLTSKKFPSKPGADKNNLFSLREFNSLSSASNSYKNAIAMFDVIEKLRKNPVVDDEGKANITDLERRILSYIYEVELEFKGAFHALKSAYFFTQNEDRPLLDILHTRTGNMIDELLEWKVISSGTYQLLSTEILKASKKK